MRGPLPSRACLLLALAALPALAQPPEPDPAPVQAAEEGSNPYAPDRPEPGSVEAIREYTTAPEYLPESVAYVPDSETVPSPAEVLGHLVGAPDELSRVADIHGYFRRLAEASDRVDARVIGTTEEGREILLAVISDEANLARLDRYKEIGGLLTDPRRTGREEARALAEEGRAVYYLTGGLHSPETGSPEMLMELAYRLAVSERPEIRAIRENAVVLITPVAEPDGRDRQVDWYYRHVRGKDMPWEELSEILSPPYWGHYARHDNNRDGMQLALALTRAIHAAFWEFRPQVLHDLHESVPLLYISTGHGPYSRAVDPVTVNEWTQLAHHEAGELSALGLPGVWVWGFWDGWWPGYLVSVANNHHAIGRFYETFGNSSAGTFERRLDRSRFAGRPVTDLQWYRPWPPDKKVTWSLRNNTNYMQAAVLEALSWAALHRRELLMNQWWKAERSLEKGRTEAPYAWVFPLGQRDPGRFTYLVNQLRAHRVEVHRLTAEARVGGKSWPGGSYVVRMDQPYRNAALNFLEVQKFPPDEPNTPYDDVAWTWPLLYGVEGSRVDDKAVLSAAMEEVTADVAAEGKVEGAGEVFLVRDTGQIALLAARVLLGSHQVDAAEAPFDVRGDRYPAGSWIVQAPAEAVAEVAAKTSLTFTATAALPEVRRHVVDLPRLAVLHTWDTQDVGWARYALDRAGVPYTLINPDDVRRGALAGRFDVILFPESGGDFARMVHGADPRHGPLAYTRTPEFPSHGMPDASPDLTVGMGFEGLANLQAFVRGGGVLVAIGNAGTLPVDGGLVRQVRKAPPNEVQNPGSELRAKVLRPDHPLAYGYEELPSVFRGNGPVWDVRDFDREVVVLQFGTKQVPEPVEEEGQGEEIEEEDVDVETPPGAAPAAAASEGKGKEKGKDEEDLVLSGFVRGKENLDGKPAILDLPVGEGRVVLFGFNPLHRYLNHSDFRFAWNAILHWNDLPR